MAVNRKSRRCCCTGIPTIVLLLAMALIATSYILGPDKAVKPPSESKHRERPRENETLAKPDGNDVDETFDFVVIGAGTGGCVAASRLSEVNDWRVSSIFQNYCIKDF